MSESRHISILVLAPSRWKLRRAVRVLNQVLSSLKLEKHPEKTFIGRIEKGFDFLGYHFSRAGLTLARTTLENFAVRALRLYEQERGKQDSLPRLGEYVQRWSGWVSGGLGGDCGPPVEAGLVGVPLVVCGPLGVRGE